MKKNMHTPKKPDANPEYTVYVQSTSPNRHLTPHTEILMFT